MPYIDQTAREHLKNEMHPHTAGELNYAITLLLIDYVESHGLNYQTIADCLSATEGAKLEFYDRVARPYEDRKAALNGDLYRALEAMAAGQSGEVGSASESVPGAQSQTLRMRS